MDSSGRRNSPNAESGVIALLDWLLAAAIALTLIVATVGIDFRAGGVSIRAHSAVRIVVVALVVLAGRWRAGITSWSLWITRVSCLTAITGSVATWFRFLLTTIGGADSWGYVSASRMIAAGRLVEPAPIAEWLSAGNRLALASPLGWAPAPDGSGIVPTYPLGLPFLMTAFSAIAGANAVFVVAPAAGLITLYLVYRLARQWYGADTALLAAALTAWNPVFIAYAKQPMSDMAATMWVMAAVVLANGSSLVSAFAAGLAGGAAVMTRPALLVAAAIVPVVAYRGESRRNRCLAAGVGVAIGVLAQMALQQRLFGSALSTGYGPAANLFSSSYLRMDLTLYARHGWEVVGPLWLVGLTLGLIAARPEPRSTPALIFGAVVMPYLFYLPFDHWETLRFILPGLVPLTIVAADGLGHVARLEKRSAVTAVLTIAFLAIVAGRSEHLLRTSSAWEIAALESRYPLAGDWINVNTPQASVVLANQHSGSLRWYGKRQTLRWDLIEPPQLTITVRELQGHGAAVFVALEGDEVQMFDQRFAGVIEQLQVDHVGRVRNVSFLRLR